MACEYGFWAGAADGCGGLKVNVKSSGDDSAPTEDSS